MKLPTPPKMTLSTRQLTVAAENIVAAQFALSGFDVLEQAGRARSLYDLVVAEAGGMMKVTVHGCVDGFWNVVDSYLEPSQDEAFSKCDFHHAIDMWLQRHGTNMTCCLVHFDSADLSGMPRIYLASGAEVAEKLHRNTELLGDSALYEEYELTDGDGNHTVESLPPQWRFSQARIAELMAMAGKPQLHFRFSEAAHCAGSADVRLAADAQYPPMMN